MLTFILGVVHLHSPILDLARSVAHLPSLSPRPRGIAVPRAFSRPSVCRIRRPEKQLWPSGYSAEEDARNRTKETIPVQLTSKCIFTGFPLESLTSPAWARKRRLMKQNSIGGEKRTIDRKRKLNLRGQTRSLAMLFSWCICLFCTIITTPWCPCEGVWS